MSSWRGKFAIAFCALGFVACMENPVGPGALSVVLVGRSNDTLWTGSPGDPFPDAVNVRVVGEGGRPVAGATLTWEAVGRSARVADVSERTDGNGRARARWLLGTDASQEQQLRVTVSASDEQAELIVRARLVPAVVSGLRVTGDTVVRLGDTLALHVEALDPYGNVFPAPDVTAAVSDSAIGHGSGAVVIGGPKRGAATVRLQSHGVGAAVPLHVTQYVAAIVPARDTLVFSALGAELPVSYVVRDDRGRVVADTVASVSVTDTNVARVSGGGAVVRSLTTGIAALSLQVASTSAVVPVVVDQRIATLRLHRDTIRFDALFDTTTLHPIAKDSLGADVQQAVLQVAVGNQQIAEVGSGTLIQSITPGVTTVTLVDPETGIFTSVPVVVHQLVRAIDINPVTFDALGDTSTAAVTPRDRLGYAVAGAGLEYSVSDTSIATVDGTGQLHSVRPGTVTLSVRDQETGALTATDVVVQQRIASLVLDRDSLTFDALLDTTAFSLVGRDRLGALVADAAARTTYLTSDRGVIDVTTAGVAHSTGNGSALIVAQSGDGPADTVRILVAQRVTAVTLARDSLLFTALNAEQTPVATPRDRLGSPVNAAVVSYLVQDSAIARVNQAGVVHALLNGATVVTASADGVSSTVAVLVAQKPFRVSVPRDTIHLGALSDSAVIAGVAVDSLGSPVTGAPQDLQIEDTAVVGAAGATNVTAAGNGVTTVHFTVAGIPGTTVVAVRQVAAAVTASLTYSKPIVTLPVGAVLPLSCQEYDSNGFAMSEEPRLQSTIAGTVTNGPCGDIRVQRSGFDTLVLGSGTGSARVSVVVAASPTVGSRLGDDADVATASGLGSPWAPSLIRNSAGQVELYYGAFATDSTGYSRSNLQRFVWAGGKSFAYDSVAIVHDDSVCSRQGQGIENMTILPRDDAPGWRMLYAAGSNACYGWQVFSAVSTDGRHWTKEPGIRLDNGNTSALGARPWPTGEGMQAFRLADGTWQLIVGTFERTTPPPSNQWAITEWRSSDELNWTYVGPVLTVRDMPVGWRGSVYSPTMREFAPGLWRMIFTADGRDNPSTNRSALWSAVSTDRVHWQLESELAGAAGFNLYYSALVDDQLVFIRRQGLDPFKVAVTTVLMP
jgi:hypothetical protein